MKKFRAVPRNTRIKRYKEILEKYKALPAVSLNSLCVSLAHYHRRAKSAYIFLDEIKKRYPEMENVRPKDKVYVIGGGAAILDALKILE